MQPVPTPDIAAALAGALLSPLESRWLHVQAVAARAEELSPAVPEAERGLLVAAAWWHDVGYSPGVVRTGMHQVDGARFLDSMGYPKRLVALVAHHSAAEFEAIERGLLDQVRCWSREESAVVDALWMADMTTGPRGERFTYAQRLEEIMSRYDAQSIVGRAMNAARPLVTEAISRTEDRLR